MVSDANYELFMICEKCCQPLPALLLAGIKIPVSMLISSVCLSVCYWSILKIDQYVDQLSLSVCLSVRLSSPLSQKVLCLSCSYLQGTWVMGASTGHPYLFRPSSKVKVTRVKYVLCLKSWFVQQNWKSNQYIVFIFSGHIAKRVLYCPSPFG